MFKKREYYGGNRYIVIYLYDFEQGISIIEVQFFYRRVGIRVVYVLQGMVLVLKMVNFIILIFSICFFRVGSWVRGF